jgi:Fe-S-cluster containining protein
VATSVSVKEVERAFFGVVDEVRAAMAPEKAPSSRSRFIPIVLKMDQDLEATGEPVACRAGCSYCCYYHVNVTAAEALAIAEHIRSRPREECERLTSRVRSTAEQVHDLSPTEYIHTNIPCALLENGKCSAYEVRPLACRGFHSTDVESCKVAFDDPYSTDAGSFAPGRWAVTEGYKSVMVAGQSLAGKDATTYELHGAVFEALTNPASSRRWKDGKVAFPSVKDRTPFRAP